MRIKQVEYGAIIIFLLSCSGYTKKDEKVYLRSSNEARIGVPEWTWWPQVIWFFVFGFIYYGWTIDAKSFPDGDIAIYFILFGLLFFLINIAIMRSRVDKIRDEIDVVIENAR